MNRRVGIAAGITDQLVVLLREGRECGQGGGRGGRDEGRAGEHGFAGKVVAEGGSDIVAGVGEARIRGRSGPFKKMTPSRLSRICTLL